MSRFWDSSTIDNITRNLSIVAIAVVFTMLACGCAHVPRVPEYQNSSQALEDLVGTWEGSYFATQGETGVTLEIYEDNNMYFAKFRFYNLPGRDNAEEGEYKMRASYDYALGAFVLNFIEWIRQPSDYVSIDLVGHIIKTKKGTFFNCGFINYYSDGDGHLSVKKNPSETTMQD